ncbi:hypothetical protein [Macrococcoides bohemicum]|uniref:hypothetical protein n=1 Tax=Macrococcoides bohemicum TaxID=1903056 RepID=UPI00193F2F41|nr:hypothetical protein [Macrococcus bohemicus]QRN48695.1 hypothetical protein HT586_00615 [Macrococcus bohemicus]
MKKILSALVVSSLVVTSTGSMVAHANTNKAKSTNEKANVIQLPNLKSKSTVKAMKAGKLTLTTSNGKKIGFNSTYQDIENKVGRPEQRKILENKDFIQVEYAYNKNEISGPNKYNVVLKSGSKHTIDNYKKAKIENILLSFNKRVSVTEIEKYIGKARSSHKINGSILKIYSDRLVISYKKMWGSWVVEEMSVESYLEPTPAELNHPTNE